MNTTNTARKFAPGTLTRDRWISRSSDHPLLQDLGRIDSYQYFTLPIQNALTGSVGSGYELWAYQSSIDDAAGLIFEIQTIERSDGLRPAMVWVWDRSWNPKPCDTAQTYIVFDSRADAVSWIAEFVGTQMLYPVSEWIEIGERYERGNGKPRGHGLPDQFKLDPVTDIATASEPPIRRYPGK